MTRSLPDPSSTSCVVTGGARGIGRGIAELMVARGHRVVLTDIDGPGAERTAAEIGAVAGLAQDVRDADSHRAVAEVAAGHGELTAWFANAGVGDDGLLTELTDEQVRRLVEVNLLGAAWSTRAALAAFGPRGGDVVLTASLSGLGPVPGLSMYAATKAAVVSLAGSLSVEAPRGVRVHALCPDGVATDMVDAMRPDGLGKRLVASGGRMLAVEEVAQAAVDLVGSRRVVRTLPGWRGGAMRVGAAAPALAPGALAVFAAHGRRRLRG